MAMNAATLSSEIREKVKNKMNLEDNPPADFFDALAEAVIKHIQDNAKVNSDTGKIE